jgi:hypothetical protein
MESKSKNVEVGFACLQPECMPICWKWEYKLLYTRLFVELWIDRNPS